MINSTVHTACKNCIFALYDGDTQVDCHAGRLEKYIARGVEIVEVYDDDKEFFVVNDRYCLYYRNRDWLSETDINADLELKVREEIQISYHAILIYHENDDLTALHESLQSILSQAIQPKVITILNRNLDKVANGQIIFLFDHMLNQVPTWKVRGAINLDLGDDAYVDIAFDGTKNIPYNFYIVSSAGYVWEKDFINNLDMAINDDLQTFHMIKQDAFKIVPKQVHAIHGGNSFKPLEDKLDEICLTIPQ